MASGANGGYSVALPLALELDEDVELRSGDILRLDVSGAGGDAAAQGEGRVDHRVWHNPKWPSSLDVALEPPLELKWAHAGPVAYSAL